ncbi:MAG: hypothetical protein H6Q14_144 [Bacteroidetes bacterium]|nr:hypothetical protein [Bacteroidota bacterium]
MSQIPATKESIQNLYDNVGSNFSCFVPILCDCVSSLESIEQFNVSETENIENNSLWKTLLKLQIFSLIINLDLSTFLRADFKTTSNPEKRFNLKYVNVITIEGYSYLFGFGKDKKNAFWNTIKNLAEQKNDNEFIADVDGVEQRAKEFENIFASREDRDNRNLTIHYDSDPIKVHSYLSQISEEKETIRTSAFLKILDDITIFIKKYIKKFQIPLICSTNNFDIDLWEKINFFPDNNNKLFNELDEKLVHFAEKLDSIVAQCEMPKLVQEKLNLDDAFSAALQPLVQTIYPGIHVFFIYLDLASTVRAYLSSESYFEKQLNLRRVNVVIYEGFKHLYGYNNSDYLQSFWHKNINVILKESTNTTQLDTLANIEHDLKALSSENDINNIQLRECSVHYRYQERDNVITLFHALIKSNPLIELNKSLKLLNILPKLLEVITESISFKYNLEQEKIKLSSNKTLAQIDNILSMIEQTKIDPEKKQQIINSIKNIRNLLL